MPARDEPDLDPDLADAVRRTYVRPVDEGSASRHLSAIVAAATAMQQPAPRPWRGRRARRPALGMGAAATLLFLPVGLATAGVSLPAAVEKPYDVVGITLPNQKPEAHRPPAAVPGSRTATTPAATSTTAKPQTPGGSGARPTASPRPKTPGANGRPSTSRRPATPPPATGSTKSNGASRGNSASKTSGNAGAKRANPAPRRPVVTPKRPAASKAAPGRKPVKPSTRPSQSPRQDPSAAPKGNPQPSGSPRKDAGA